MMSSKPSRARTISKKNGGSPEDYREPLQSARLFRQRKFPGPADRQGVGEIQAFGRYPQQFIIRYRAHT